MTWIEGIHYVRSVRGAHECPIGVFTGAVGDDLSTRDRRSAGVLNQAMHPSLHLTGSANGEPKDQGNHHNRSRVNEGERDQMPIFSHCWPPAEAVPVGLSDTRKEVPNDVQESPPFWPFLGRLDRCFSAFWPRQSPMRLVQPDQRGRAVRRGGSCQHEGSMQLPRRRCRRTRSCHSWSVPAGGGICARAPGGFDSIRSGRCGWSEIIAAWSLRARRCHLLVASSGERC